MTCCTSFAAARSLASEKLASQDSPSASCAITSGARSAPAGSSRYGPLQVLSWASVHQKLEHGSGGWEGHPGPLPDIPGTLIRLSAPDALPGYRPLKPMWIWASSPDAAPDRRSAALPICSRYASRMALPISARWSMSKSSGSAPIPCAAALSRQRHRSWARIERVAWRERHMS